MQNENPLVSIIVITYNSSKYVLETLESAKVQTYRNIELIVSDDCSTDHTVELCRHWLEKNKEYFVRAEMITAEKNTGIAPNCNRGLYAAKGEWVKFIAGDDKLYENCINNFIKEIKIYPEKQVIFSNISINGIEKSASSNLISFFSFETKDQYLKLLEGNILPAPASFLKKSVLIKLNGFDERFPFFEDFPFFLKASKSGIKLYFINEHLVYYRVTNEGISNKKRMNIHYQRSVMFFFSDIFLQELTINKLFLFKIHYLQEYFLLKLSVLGIIKYQKHYSFLLNYLSILCWQRRINNMLTKSR